MKAKEETLIKAFTTKQIDQLNNIISKYQKKPEDIILLLEEAQKVLKYLPKSVLRKIALETKMSLRKIYGIVTFYSFFTMEPRGRHLIQVCLGTACYVKGGKENIREIEGELKVKPGETTVDRRFTLETVRCLGTCGLAPVMVVDGEVYGRVKSSELNKILSKYP